MGGRSWEGVGVGGEVVRGGGVGIVGGGLWSEGGGVGGGLWSVGEEEETPRPPRLQFSPLPPRRCNAFHSTPEATILAPYLESNFFTAPWPPPSSKDTACPLPKPPAPHRQHCLPDNGHRKNNPKTPYLKSLFIRDLSCVSSFRALQALAYLLFPSFRSHKHRCTAKEVTLLLNALLYIPTAFSNCSHNFRALTFPWVRKCEASMS